MMAHEKHNIPGILTWKKDLNSTYIEANSLCATLFGFKKEGDILGCTDYDIPCKLSNFSEIFREHDRQVILNKRNLRLLEIQPCIDDIWRVFLVTKTPLYTQDGKVQGTSAHSVDLTDFIKNMPHILEYCVASRRKNASGSYIITKEFSNIRLSARQSECLYFLMKGMQIKEIAKKLALSPRTVEHYLEAIREKFKCDKRSDLIEKGFEMGIANMIPSSILQTQLSISLPESEDNLMLI